MVLANAGANFTVTANGSFAFPTALATGSAYAVTVQTQPANQTCSVANGTGTIPSSAVSNVTVTCANSSYTVRGTITGLSGAGLVLQNNGGDNQTIAANGTTFQFPTAVAGNSAYAVTVLAQPAGPSQICTVANGSGPGTGVNVTNVAITCATNTYPINVNVTGMTGTGLVLSLNGSSNLTFNTNVVSSFATQVVSGGTYVVAPVTQPTSPANICTIANANGTVTSAAVTVNVTCVNNAFTIGGTISGLTGTGLQLTRPGAAVSVLPNATTFTFPGTVGTGTSYQVQVAVPPSSPAQNCIVGNANGIVANANITNIAVTCVNATFAVGGTVSGLTSSGLKLKLNNGTELAIVANQTAFSFPTQVVSGGTYLVTLFAQPAGQTCTLSNASGTISASPVSNVTVTCRSRLAFLSNEGGTPRLTSYSVLPNGGLGQSGLQPVATNTNVPGTPLATGVAVTADGTHMIAAVDSTNSAAQDGELQVFSVDGAGLFIPRQTLRMNQHSCSGLPNPGNSGQLSCGLAKSSAPETVLIHPNGRFVYVMDGVAHGACTTSANPCVPPAGEPVEGNRTIVRYTLNTTTHQLTYNDQHYCEGFISMAIDPQGRFLWCTSYLERQIYAFAINQTDGSLTFSGGTFIGQSNGEMWMGIDPNGNYAYVSHAGDHTIDSYTINQSTGRLVNIGSINGDCGAPGANCNKATGVDVWGLAVSANGRTLYGASTGVIAYSLESDGSINTASRTPYNSSAPLGSAYRSLVGVGSGGQYLYLQGYTEPSARVFLINGSTGALTESPASPAPLAAGTSGVTQLFLQ